MSQSPEEASRGHDCGSLYGKCNCCPCCNNMPDCCTCCKSCKERLDMCACDDRIKTIWPDEHHCEVCDLAYDEACNEVYSVIHSSGVPCPNCCFRCKTPTKECICCRACLIPHPCICDREQHNTIAVEKRKNARSLIRRFLRKVICQKKTYFPANTVKPDDE
jgi:hypothetical protein